MKNTLALLFVLSFVSVVSAADIEIANFEGKKLEKGVTGVAFLSAKGGGAEETAADTLTLSLNTNAQYVKSGKQSLGVIYKMNPASDLKYANLTFTGKKPAGTSSAVSLWIYKVSGTVSVKVTVFDSKWKTGVSQPITLTDGAQTIVLHNTDFSGTYDWSSLSVVQMSITGNAVLYVDDVKFTNK